MARSARFSVVAPLPVLRGFRRALAVDRSGLPRAVVLSFAPPEVVDDPARLDALLRAVEAAGRVLHPGAAAVLGTETVDGALAVVEQHRPGTSLRAILDGAGRTPPDVAVRIGVEVAAALARIHRGEGGHPGLAHGAVESSCIEVSDEGEIVLRGLGLAPTADLAADLRGLGAVLHECLAGEPPGEPPQPLDVPGVPADLAAAVDRASGAVGPGYASASAFSDAIAGAVSAPATAADVAAYADAIVPPEDGEREALGRALEAALAEAAPPPPAAEAPAVTAAPEPSPATAPETATPEPVAATAPETAAAAPEPPAEPSPRADRADAAPAPPRPRSLDSGQTFPVPLAARPRRRLPVIVGIVALALGFAVGFAAQRAYQPAAPAAARSAP